MGQSLEIRIPEPVLEILRARADERHLSLAEYALEVLIQHAQMKAMNEVLGCPLPSPPPRGGRGLWAQVARW